MAPSARSAAAPWTVGNRLTVIVLVNLDDDNVEAIAAGVAALYLQAPAPVHGDVLQYTEEL
jgi:hypothetical protein